MSKKLWAMLAVVLLAASCSSSSANPSVGSGHYTEDDLSANFLGWATMQIDAVAAESYVETVVNQLNDTPDQAPCFINDTVPDSCTDLWQQSLKEWSADCNPPRNAALVVCPDEGVGAPPTTTVPATTSTADLTDAAAKIEQAHEGIGNIIHNDDGSDNNGCETKCGEELADAISKTAIACNELHSDILNLRTWDHNQTVGHACYAANYWLGETSPVDEGTHRAEYQLGILRDVLNDAVKNRQNPPSLGATSQTVIKDAAAKVQQAHDGLGNIIRNNYNKWAEDCGDHCQAAIDDAANKTASAQHELGPDVLNIRTWDNNQTVGHAFWAANYWFGQLKNHFDDSTFALHAEYQLGILRDVLNGQVHYASFGATEATPKSAIDDAHAKVLQAHEGIANVLKHNINGTSPCNDHCTKAIHDAVTKTQLAEDELGPDVLNIHTWDNNYTIGHAFWAADYWLDQLNDYPAYKNAAQHALYQLGILRDALDTATN